MIFTSRSPTDKNTKHTQMTHTCGHILRNNTNSTNANQRGGIVTAQSTAEDPLKMVVKKDRNMLGFYTYKHVFNILLVLNVEVIVFLKCE